MKTNWQVILSFYFFGIIGCSKKEALPIIEQPIDIAVSNNVFAIIGDYGDDGEPEFKVSELVKSWQPDFIITLGDNNYPDGAWNTMHDNIGKYYCDYIYNPDAPIENQCSGRAASDQINYFFPSPGNHDYIDSNDISPYLDYFTLPGTERNYTFTWGPIHFFSIDSKKYGVGVDPEIKNWLKKSIAASTLPFKLIYFHHPPYSTGHHGNIEEMQWDFAEWGATAVLSGHNHIYEHIVKKSAPELHYFVNGLSGRNQLYDCNSNPLDSSEFDSFCYDENFGAMKVTANSERLTLSMFSIENGGTLIDEVVIER